MGIFINKSEHPGVFQHKGEIENIPNQNYFKTDYFAELIQEQKNFNESLTKEVKNIKIRHQQNEFTGAKKWRDLSSRLEQLYKETVKHENFEQDVRKWLQVLDNKNQELKRLMEDEKDVKQEYIENKLNQVSQSNQEIISQLSEYKSFSEQLTSQMSEMHTLHQQMAEQISKQDEKQEKVLDSFENQEALMEKTFRQLDNLRSILFERTYHIVEKIENSWKPLSFMMPGKNKEEKEKVNK
ncbi:hypothetical protein ACTWP4_11880 [Gracilibacillus sp. D59]|uniref:hypothetical protein n=1 Tax=Gracilibacillus sp. D59 TaxID=3457434 RepID=UPI003FCD4032